MDDAKSLNRRYETIAWGAFFIWLGITSLFPGLPNGASTIGIGLIFLGLNAARMFSDIPLSGFTVTLGVLALVLGGAEMARALLHFEFDLPVFPIVLIVLGVLMLARAMMKTNRVNE